MRFARGDNALGRCERCGDKVRYSELMSDKQTPGLRVCSDCFDIKHPVEKPFRTDEGIALAKPAPDIDDDSPGDSGVDLVTALGLTNSFGGGT
jgi:hypothetical protein